MSPLCLPGSFDGATSSWYTQRSSFHEEGGVASVSIRRCPKGTLTISGGSDRRYAEFSSRGSPVDRRDSPSAHHSVWPASHRRRLQDPLQCPPPPRETRHTY